MENCCGNCSQANKWDDSAEVLKCECHLSGYSNTPELKIESCERHRKATKEWIERLNS
jgi:hypothetical protein